MASLSIAFRIDEDDYSDVVNGIGTLEIAVSTPDFSARARDFSRGQELKHFANALAAHPLPAVEVVSFEASGGNSIAFRAENDLGHLRVRLTIKSDCQLASLTFLTDYAALETFRNSILSMLNENEGEASLAGWVA